MNVIWVLIGFALLVIGGEFLVRASVALSFKLRISRFVIGLTVVSFATSAPELLVSLNAAMQNAPAIAIDNVVGSNIANLGLVLGVTAIIGSIKVESSFYRLNWPVMMLLSIMLYIMLRNDGVLQRYEGAALLGSLVVFLYVLIRGARKDRTTDNIDDTLAIVSYFRIAIWILIATIALYFGADFLVDGAIEIAEQLGVSQAVISVSLIAVGTSVPELAASVIAIAKNEKAISIGNLIGSNIFNIGSVLGITSVITPIPVTDHLILERDIFWMLLFAAIVLPMVFIPRKFYFGRIEGFVLAVLYSVFITLLFVQG